MLKKFWLQTNSFYFSTSTWFLTPNIIKLTPISYNIQLLNCDAYGGSMLEWLCYVSSGWFFLFIIYLALLLESCYDAQLC